jgi:hypothetical protein
MRVYLSDGKTQNRCLSKLDEDRPFPEIMAVEFRAPQGFDYEPNSTHH